MQLCRKLYVHSTHSLRRNFCSKEIASRKNNLPADKSVVWTDRRSKVVSALNNINQYCYTKRNFNPGRVWKLYHKLFEEAKAIEDTRLRWIIVREICRAKNLHFRWIGLTKKKRPLYIGNKALSSQKFLV